MRARLKWLALAATIAIAPVPAAGQGRPGPAGAFDFYVLALSWSPSHCERAGARADRRQCGLEADHGFIVHGLWPQHERGWPEECVSAHGRSVPARLVSDMLDIMPSPGLIRHQWRKHGRCSGLAQSDYFALVRRAFAVVTIPERFRRSEAVLRLSPGDIEAEFRRANPGLDADAVSVACDRSRLRDVRICMTKQLAFRACPQVDRRGCRRGSLRVPAASRR